MTYGAVERESHGPGGIHASMPSDMGNGQDHLDRPPSRARR